MTSPRKWDTEKQELQGGTAGGAGGLAGYVAGSRYEYARRPDPWKPGGRSTRKQALKHVTRGRGKYYIAAAAGLGATGGYGMTKGKQKYDARKVAKRMSPERKLSYQKKAQAATSLAGGTVGLTGLGMLAAGKRFPKAITHLPKVTAVGGGIGGVGAYNFASIQNQESKQRAPRQNVYVVRNKRQIKNIKSGLEPVKKGLEAMDFGLSDVRHGENVHVISKRERKWETPESAALQQKSEKRSKQAGAAGSVGAAGALGWYGANMSADVRAATGKGNSYRTQQYNLKGQTQNMREAYTHATKAGWNGNDPLPRRKTVKPLLKFGARAVKNNPHAAAGKVGGAVALGGIGTSMVLSSKATKAGEQAQTLRNKNRRASVGKSSDWMNISEHQRRARDSRRTRNRAESAAGWGGAVATGAVAHRAGTATGQRYPNMDQQMAGLKGGYDRAKFDFKYSRASGEGLKSSAQWAQKQGHLGRAIKANPHAAAVTGGAALLAGGVATSAGARVNEKRHDRAVANLRRKRVGKAYNPEDKRQRRLENTATGLSIGSGAAGAGAIPFAMKAGGLGRHKGLRAKSLPAFKTGLKNAGKAGALGATSVGLAVASDRVRSYRRGNGGTYRQLHRGS
jgi:hypothetical protein